ncbi:MAG: hypothetical protein WC314_07385 [Vulcanimicrobiota bacterium]
MELKQLTQIQDKISSNRLRRRRTLRKLRGNGISGRALINQKMETSSNSGQDRLVVTQVRCNSKRTETAEEICKRLFAASGWVVRSHFNDPNFRVEALQDRNVAFTLRGENNELLKYSGVLQGVSKAGSALFRLVGQEGVFNSNLVSFMATRPEVCVSK